MLINKDVEKLIDNEITGLGFVFIGLELENQGHNKLIRVYVDTCNDSSNMDRENFKVNGVKPGVTIEECGKISRHLSKFMSVIPNFNINSYILEVSSPGLERKLFNLSQFVHQLGKEIKLRLRIPIEGRSNFIGVLQEVDCKFNKIFVEVDKQQICLDYDNIAKANLVYRKL